LTHTVHTNISKPERVKTCLTSRCLPVSFSKHKCCACCHLRNLKQTIRTVANRLLYLCKTVPQSQPIVQYRHRTFSIKFEVHNNGRTSTTSAIGV